MSTSDPANARRRVVITSVIAVLWRGARLSTMILSSWLQPVDKYPIFSSQPKYSLRLSREQHAPSQAPFNSHHYCTCKKVQDSDSICSQAERKWSCRLERCTIPETLQNSSLPQKISLWTDAYLKSYLESIPNLSDRPFSGNEKPSTDPLCAAGVAVGVLVTAEAPRLAQATRISEGLIWR